MYHMNKDISPNVLFVLLLVSVCRPTHIVLIVIMDYINM